MTARTTHNIRTLRTPVGALRIDIQGLRQRYGDEAFAQGGNPFSANPLRSSALARETAVMEAAAHALRSMSAEQLFSAPAFAIGRR
ncbi:hypothetical protein BH11PSE11_BH11PSE11_19350 [soil metagenome]